MAETGARNDPFFAFRFEVRIDRLPIAGFSDCTGLSLETEIKDYPEGGLNTHLLKFPGRIKQSNITLKRGIAGKELWDWFDELNQGVVEFRNGSILVKDPAGDEDLGEWQFQDAFLTKWQGPELSATQNNVAVETLELCHQGLKRLK